MKPQNFLQILHTAEHLKDVTRHATTSHRRAESVAEHSWRMGLMALLLKDEFPQADMDKVVQMCLIHDLGELFTGDIPTFLKTDAHRETEDSLLSQWVATFPAPYADSFAALYEEMNAQKTLEANIYKAIDKLEAVIQHNESPLDTWEDHEYQLNRTYATDTVAFSDYLVALRAAIRAETEEKIASGT